MFVGHYGVSFAAKRGDRTIPLWVLFVAVQLLDVSWSLFVFFGIEKVRIVPGITASNPLDLYYMPYTHSLVAALLWSLGAYVAYRAIRAFGASHRAALLVALAVFSHWVLDLVVHRPDLPLYDNVAKVGLGLWNYPAPAFLLEVALLFGGMFLYLRSTTATTRLGSYGIRLIPAVRRGRRLARAPAGLRFADRNCCADAPLPPRLGRSTLQKARRRSMRPDP